MSGTSIVGVAIAVVIGAVVGAVLATRAHPRRAAQPLGAVVQPSEHNLEAQAVWPAHKRRAPDFLLRDQANRPFSLSSQQGRVVLLTFLDSRCKRACPIEGRLVNYDIDVQRATLDINHSTAVYVLDQSGYERMGYLFPFTVRAVSAAVRLLERK